ncbi:FAD-dependent oxidoreductase [Pseudonocardia sp. NPDC049635]|uniref:FAD-dependent oxidoreductase n=1 Tax=Pseudonocardia sp. NPDC049635 TaxID=3155506 RepID=UPI0033DB1FB8
MNSDAPFLVVGCGGIGSAALYWLARTAAPYSGVLGLEQRAPGPDHDTGRREHSRTFGLTPRRDVHAALAPHAHRTWRQVESLSGQTLLTETGGLVITDVGAGHGPGTAVAPRHGGAPGARADDDTTAELLDAGSITARWPQFRLHGTERALHRRRSGVLDVRRADATHVALARGHGAQIRENSPVRVLHDPGRHVEVVTDDEIYRAERVVVAVDAGTNEVLDGLLPALPLTATQEVLTYYATPNLIDFSPERFPVFRWHGAEDYTGFGVHAEVATGLGERRFAPEATAAPWVFEPDPLHHKRQEAFLAEHVPGMLGPELCTTTSLCTTPPDGRLVLGTVPGHPRVSVAVGAGPASAFTSLLGRILAELALTGRTGYPIEEFALDRPALTDSRLLRTRGV